MRRTKRKCSFILCLLINMLLNIEWTIPAVILLVFHFLLDISVLWAAIALGLWVIGLVLGMLIIGWAAGCGSSHDKPKENKNPYSAGNKNKLT